MSYPNARGYYTSTRDTNILPSIMLPAVVAAIMFIAEYIWRASVDVSLRFITLVDYTAQSSDGVVIISQDPSNPASIQLGTSVNERTGVEFAYSFFILVKESTFSDGTLELKHVFHRGYKTVWPLMCPGVFIRGDTNTMRVVINTNRNVCKYADVTNIPINKWFHVVLNCSNSGLDVHINANLAHRIKFENEVIYQNFEDLIIFSPNRTRVKAADTAMLSKAPGMSDDGGTLIVSGSFDGNLSSMKYARYAMSLKEINALMNAGPSSKVTTNVPDTNTGYLSDTWWSDQQN